MDFTLSFPVSTNVIISVFFTVCSFVLVCLHALLRPKNACFLGVRRSVLQILFGGGFCFGYQSSHPCE